MVQSDDHFEEFAPHSRYKQLILKAYFDAWLRKLGLRPGAGATLCYVDACAGRGADSAGNDGSPVVAARAASEASRQMTAMRGAAPSISVIAIEKEAANHSVLVDNLAAFMPAAEALLGELRDHLPALEERFGETPTLFFIDPFGLAPLQADVVRRALAGPRNEVLLLFADQAALRHFGAAMATESKAAREHRKQVEAAPLMLFPDFELKEAAARAPRVAKSQKALEITRKRAIEILDAAFGGSTWRANVESVADTARRARFRQLYADFLRACDAEFVLDIPVFNEDGEHVYTLIHATKNESGYRTMKEAVASALNKAPLPERVVAAMKAEMAVELLPIVEMLCTRFAGETVRWAEGDHAKSAFSLKRFVLVETPIQSFQLGELQELLKPFSQPGRTIVYTFPQVRTAVD